MKLKLLLSDEDIGTILDAFIVHPGPCDLAANLDNDDLADYARYLLLKTAHRIVDRDQYRADYRQLTHNLNKG